MSAHSFLRGVMRCSGIVTRRNSSLRSRTSCEAERGVKAGRVGSSDDPWAADDEEGAVGRSDDGEGAASVAMSSSESESDMLSSSTWWEARAEPTVAGVGAARREGPASEEEDMAGGRGKGRCGTGGVAIGCEGGGHRGEREGGRQAERERGRAGRVK